MLFIGAMPEHAEKNGGAARIISFLKRANIAVFWPV
jgi:hypothetical protein